MHERHELVRAGDPTGAPAIAGGAAPPGSQLDLGFWREITNAADLRRLLERFATDERLALAARCMLRMRSVAVLLDARRVLVAAAARLAYHAEEYAGDEALEPWIDARIDRALVDLLDEDAIDDRDDRPVAPDDERYAHLASQFRTDARTARRATVVFQRLPHEERAAFFAVLVDGLAIERHALEAGVSPEVAERRFERAVTSFCSLGARREPDPAPPERSAR